MIRTVLALFVAAVLPVPAQNRQTIPLWPHGAPGPKNAGGEERDTTTPQDDLIAGRYVIRSTDIADPILTVYPAPSRNNSGAAVLVFPGGGYRILAYDLEGTEVCQMLNRLGVNAILVKYRVPQPAGIPRFSEPLQDAQRAIGLVRLHAKEWAIDPARVGVLGFSAGGHLSALLSNSEDKRTYRELDAADRQSAHPNFTILVYPAYLSVEDKGVELSPEVRPGPQTAPTFIVQAEDDKTFIGSTLVYYRALQLAHIPTEMHLYSAGGHGFGVRPTSNPVTGWPALLEAWLRYQKILISK